MDTEATRPRARIDFLRRRSSPSGAGVQVDPSRAVSPVEAGVAAPALEALRDHAAMLRQRIAAAKPRQAAPSPTTEPEIADGADEPVVPRSIVNREPLPADGWLKRLFAASRIARYRRLKRPQQVGRHEDVSV